MNGCDLRLKTVLSFDVDRTLVDRRGEIHRPNSHLKKLLEQANSSPNLEVVLNTGRDLGALSEFDCELGITLNAIFMSGRGIRFQSMVRVIDTSVLDQSLIERAIHWGVRANCPFIDLKTEKEVFHISIIEDHQLPFGFQKPVQWYKRYSPKLIEAEAPNLVNSLMRAKPIRLEIPVKRQEKRTLQQQLKIPADYSVETFSIHSSQLIKQPELEDWCVLQVLTGTEKHNKATGLAAYLTLFPKPSRIIHFGDSNSRHNDDSVVQSVLPQSHFVRIDWDEEAADRTIARAVSPLLH